MDTETATAGVLLGAPLGAEALAAIQSVAYGTPFSVVYVADATGTALAILGIASAIAGALLLLRRYKA